MASRSDCVVVHPGVQHSAQLALALEELGRLEALVTGLQVGRGAPFPYGIDAVSRRLHRRTTRLADDRIVRVSPVLTALSRTPKLRTSGAGQRIAAFADQSFARRASGRLSDSTRVVIGTDMSSGPLFRHLAEARPDVLRVLDVSHPSDVVRRRLVEEDALKHGLDVRAYDDYPVTPVIDQTDEMTLADRVIVASRFSASKLPDLVDPAKVRIVPYGVNVPDALAARAGSGSVFRILFLGALSERKGVTLLLRAMERLGHERPRSELRLIGVEAGAYRLPDRLPENTTHASGLTHAEVQAELRSADLFVLPSMCEGFGRVLLESLAVGTPVLVSRTSGGPDILERCPDAPLRLIDNLTVDGLTSALRAERDRGQIPPETALECARAFSEHRYRQDLVDALEVD